MRPWSPRTRPTAGGARAATAARTDADEVLEEIRALEDALASDAGAGTAPVSAKERMRRSNLLLSERQTVLALRTRLATAADAYSALGGVAIPAADGAAYNVSGSPMLAGTTPSSARRVLLSRPTASGTRPPATAVPGSFSGSPRPTYASAAGAVGSPIRGTAPSGTDYVATDNAGLVLMQRETLGAQEQAVGVLGTIAARLKHQAYAIGDEVDVQNEMLDDLGGQMDRVEAKVKAGEKKARKLAGGR
ncbi:hypothetical protein BC828DRAFT_145563 [Blastocladiella britannica]|nr:hypothetical protein BC828DRAFT_145563 [Blastocladiella britannica]